MKNVRPAFDLPCWAAKIFLVVLFLSSASTVIFAQSTEKFFGMNYWEYQIYASGASVDKFQQNMPETSTWNCSIVRLGGNHANTSRNKDSDRDWYVTAIQNIKSMNLTPLVQLPINLTATQVGQWMDYFNVTKGLGIIYWGIGNEPDPSSNWDAWYAGTYFHDGRNYSGFKAQFRLIAKAIKAKDANSIICGPDYRHWWGTATDGPFGKWYKDFIMGASAIATDTYNGDPIVDIFPFHFYGDANEATMISRYAILNPMIAAANALRPANQPLKIAVGEYNTDVTVGPETFVAGQYMAVMAKQALANGCVYFAPWSVEEGNNFRMIESNGTLRSTAQHMKMLSQNKRANYMSGQINNNFTNNIMEFGMQDANGYTIMVMNKSATDYSFSVKFSTTSGTYSAANTTLKFRFNANVNIDFSNVTLFKNSTLLFTFNAAGNMLKKIEYRSGYTAPVITNYPVGNTPPSVNITAPATGSTAELGTAINITATASDAAPGTVASVSFYDGATLLGTDLTSPYSFSLTGASLGAHSITAKATDNNAAVTTSASVTVTVVNTPPTVSITSPAAGSSFTSGTTIALAATAADAAPGTVASVSFYDGATLLGTDVTSPYSFSWAGATVGTHSITAKATDNNGATTTSAAVSLTVTAVTNDPLTLSYFHFVNKWTADYMRPTAGLATATITQYEETAVPTLDSYQWEFRKVTGTSYYYIINKYTQKAIQPTGGSIADGVGLSQTTLTPTNEGLTELHWSVTLSDEAPYYWIMNRKSQRHIRPNAGTNGTGVPIVQNTLNATLSSFKWNLVDQGLKSVAFAAAMPGIAEEPVATTPVAAATVSAASVAAVSNNILGVYPNPSNGILYVNTEVDKTATVRVIIYNASGIAVLSKEYRNRTGWFAEQFDISHFAAGSYMVKIIKGGVTETKNIVKN